MQKEALTSFGLYASTRQTNNNLRHNLDHAQNI